MSRDAIEVIDAEGGYRADADTQYVPHGYKRTVAGIIPEDWEAWPVGSMGGVITGKALAAYAPGQQRPYLRTKNVLDGRIDIDDVLTMPMTDAQFEHFRVRLGDVLLNEGQSLELVGRCAIYRGEYPQPCAMQNQLLRFRATQGVSAEFAGHLFRHAQRTGIFARIALQTTSIAHLGTTRFALLKLPWPKTEEEQRAIAEALSDVDRLLGALESLIDKKRAIKQAAMQQLLTGKTRLPGFSGEWETKRIDELAIVDPENLSTTTDPGFAFHYISLEQVDAGRLLAVAEEVFQSAPSRARRILRHGDVLMSTVRPNLMAHLHFKSQVTNAICSTGFSVLRVRPDRADAGYLCAHLFGHVINNRIEKILAGSNYPAISGRDVRMLKLPCPPTIAEQTAIATVLSEMQAEITALEARRDKTIAIKQGMMQQLLTGRVRLLTPAEATTC
ncbi:MAG: restriction endonuclease subunit S [Pseudomonadales bacterium]